MGLRDYFFSDSTNTQPEINKVPAIYTSEQEQERILKMAMRGEVVLDKEMFPAELGEKHPFNSSITESLYKQYPLVKGVVDKYIDFILGSGFYVKSEDERAQTIIEQFNKDVDMDSVLRNWILEALIKPQGIIELGGSRNGTVEGIKVLDAKYIYVLRDKKGKIVQYNQYKGAFDTFSKQKIIKFEPYEIAQLCFSKVGDCAYGLGIVSPNVSVINRLIKAEQDMHILLGRKANAPLHVKLGNDEYFVNPSDVSAFGAELEWMTNKHEWATNHLVEMKVVDFGKIGDKFDSVIQHDLKMLFAGFQVPEVLLGSGNIPEGLAQVQMDAFQRDIQSKQVEIEKIIEEKIYRRVLLANGIQSHVEFEWGKPSDTETNARIDRLTMLLNNMNLSPELRYQLEVELSNLLGFDSDLLLTPEEQRKREESQPTPPVPGQNRPTNQSYHIHEDLEQFDNRPLQEWLDFNYLDYLAEILSILNEEEFTDLRAKDKAELLLGKLSSAQITTLREVLKDGFKANKTLLEIAEDIRSKVKPGDLVNQDGKLILSSDARGMNIARTETTKLAAKGALNQYKINGIQQYSWVASLGKRTCSICESLNGQVFEIGKGPLPGQPHPMCRCTIAPVVKQ